MGPPVLEPALPREVIDPQAIGPGVDEQVDLVLGARLALHDAAVDPESDRVAGKLRVLVKVKYDAFTPARAPAEATSALVFSTCARFGPYVAAR